MQPQVISEAARDIEVIDDVDVLIVGGGPAGVSAAVAAARAGARTFLVERHGFLGGMWTAGMVLTLAGFNSLLRPYQRCVAGIGGEWLARATARGGAEDNEGFLLNSDPETMKLVADDLLEAAGVSFLFHTWGARPYVEDGRVRGAFLENVDGRRAILAKVTVDGTGNGDIAARAGAPWNKGQTLQPMTMPFRMGNVALDPTRDHTAPATIPIGPDPVVLEGPLLNTSSSRRLDVEVDYDAMRAARKRGELPPFGGPWFGGLEKDVLWVNTTRVVGDASVAGELTRAEVAARRDTQTILTYFRDHLPGFERAALLHTSSQIGVRETRRIIGEYTLTERDIVGGATFDDSIAVGCWPIDIHPADGDVGVHAMYVPAPYQIPYRTLIPLKIDGLVMAGRCISVTHEALGSTRVGATCAAIGQAAGVAAALAAADDASPRTLDVGRLRQTLRSQDAIIDPPCSR